MNLKISLIGIIVLCFVGSTSLVFAEHDDTFSFRHAGVGIVHIYEPDYEIYKQHTSVYYSIVPEDEADQIKITCQRTAQSSEIDAVISEIKKPKGRSLFVDSRVYDNLENYVGYNVYRVECNNDRHLSLVIYKIKCQDDEFYDKDVNQCNSLDDFTVLPNTSEKEIIIDVSEDVSDDDNNSTTDTKKSNGSGDNKHLTAPTFGADLSNPSRMLVEGGYTHNDTPYDITDNWHTPFEKVDIQVGEPFDVKIKGKFANGMKGMGWGLVPQVGAFHKAEIKIFAYTNYSDEIEEIEIIQKDYNIIDADSLIFDYYQEPCGYVSSTCDVLHISNMTLLEIPFFEKVAIYGIDDKKRTHITYLNEGYNITGESLNPPKTLYTFGKIFTEIDKFNPIWTDEQGIQYEKNSYNSMKRITPHPDYVCSDPPLDQIKGGYGRENCHFRELVSIWN